MEAKHTPGETESQRYRRAADFSTDRSFIEYVLECAQNITDNECMRNKYGLIPPMLQLHKLEHETEVYLNATKAEGGQQ